MRDSSETRKRTLEIVQRYRNGEAPEFFAELADGYEALLEAVRSYEEGITWETTCLGCAKLMSQLYDQDCLIDQIRTLVGCKLPHVPEEDFPFESCPDAAQRERDWKDMLNGGFLTLTAKFWSGEVQVAPEWSGEVTILKTFGEARMSTLVTNPFPPWPDPNGRVFFLYEGAIPVAEGTVVERLDNGSLSVALQWL